MYRSADCRWFDIPRRTVYYRPTKKAPILQKRFARPIEQMIEEDRSFGYRTVAHLLGFNKNTVQRIFQLRHWQVRKRPIGFRPRVRAMPSVATTLNERWVTDLCRVWSGRDGWAVLALVIDCCSRELLGWHLSRSSRGPMKSDSSQSQLPMRWLQRQPDAHRAFAKICQKGYCPAMSTMNISLPDSLKDFIDEQVDQRGFGTSSEYIRELVRKEQERLQLRGLLLAGASSAPTKPVDGAYFDGLRKKVRAIKPGARR